MWRANEPPSARLPHHVSSTFKLNDAEKQTTDAYHVLRVLGEGTFGTASAAVHRKTGKEYVVKTVDRTAVASQIQLEREVAVQAQMDHPHIVRIYEMFDDGDILNMIMEFCRGGELADIVEQQVQIGEDDARHIFAQVIQAVHYMHRKLIAHRDLKFENFLVKEVSPEISNCTIKLIDFGFAKKFSGPDSSVLKTVCGSPGYMAPEVFDKQYDEKCDIFSCGVMLYCLLAGRMPFEGNSIEELIQNARNKPLKFDDADWNDISMEARKLVWRTCAKVPSKRFTAQEVIDSTWLEDGSDTHSDLDNSGFSPDMVKNALSYRSKCPFQQLALHCAAYNTEDETLKSLRDAFKFLDKDKSGNLSIEEVRKGLQHFPEFAGVDVDEFFEHADMDGNSGLEWTEFISAFMDHSSISSQVLHTVFNHLDTEGRGEISIPKFCDELEGYAKFGSMDAIRQSVASMDTNGNGTISLNEFVSTVLPERRHSIKLADIPTARRSSITCRRESIKLHAF